MSFLKQGQYEPQAVEKQVVIIFAGTHGYLDKHPTDKLKKYEQQLYQYIDSKYPEIFKDIVASGKLDDQLKPKLERALQEFDSIFAH